MIEVADSSARHDLAAKSGIYAQAGIPEYWLVLLKERAVEVLREPESAARSYRSRFKVSGDATVAPAAFEGPAISVPALFD